MMSSDERRLPACETPQASPSGSPTPAEAGRGSTSLGTCEEIIAGNYRRVCERIAAACARRGRDPAEVTLIAVTKYAEFGWVRALVKCGAADLGESRPQQLVARAGALGEPVCWHLIGSLQRNKVRMVLPVAELIHSVDSIRLLETIDRIAGETERRPRLLLEVNLSGETSKHGFTADGLRAAWDRFLTYRHVQIEGLMTMAAYSDNPEDSRAVFAALRQLRDELQPRAAAPLAHLSMGMSGDFEPAIEEGATLVRIGSALWEGLSPVEDSPAGNER